MKKRNPKPQTITIYRAEAGARLLIPFIEEGIKAGFPSPATDYIERGIDLNTVLIKNRESTFYARADGNSMIETGILDGDLVVIDKSLEIRDGCKVVAWVDDGFCMKTIKLEKDKILLIPENPDYPIITVNPDDRFEIWGVVTYVIHKLY